MPVTFEMVAFTRNVNESSGFLNGSGEIPVKAGVYLYTLSPLGSEMQADLPPPAQDGQRIRLRAKNFQDGSLAVAAGTNSNEFSSLDFSADFDWADLWGKSGKWIFEGGNVTVNA